jgi:hypothetical protein
MPDGLRHLRQAVAVLSYLDEDLPSRDLLAKAFREVWLASADWTRWPTELREAAERLVTLSFRDGAIRYTAQRMTDEEVRDAAALIRRLAAEAERLGETG